MKKYLAMPCFPAYVVGVLGDTEVSLNQTNRVLIKEMETSQINFGEKGTERKKAKQRKRMKKNIYSSDPYGGNNMKYINEFSNNHQTCKIEEIT
jgi:hypothetical protein